MDEEGVQTGASSFSSAGHPADDPRTERIELRCHDVRHTSGRMVFKAADQQAAKLHLAHDGGSTTDHYLKERLDELAKLKQQLFERPVDEQ
jgi:hypothetical protein